MLASATGRMQQQQGGEQCKDVGWKGRLLRDYRTTAKKVFSYSLTFTIFFDIGSFLQAEFACLLLRHCVKSWVTLTLLWINLVIVLPNGRVNKSPNERIIPGYSMGYILWQFKSNLLELLILCDSLNGDSVHFIWV